MGLKELAEFPLENPCALCGRRNDLPDDCYCSACCYAQAMAAQMDEYPDFIDNFKGWLAHKLGVGTLPAMSIIMLELGMSHVLHHPVILPTPVGHDMIEMAVRQGRIAKEVTVKNGKGVVKAVAKIRTFVPKRV